MKYATPHKTSGKLIYDPHRGEMKARTDWWCVVNVDREITRYYRWWLQYTKHIYLQPPSFDAHVSVIRGEKPIPNLMHLWKKYQGQKFDLEYGHVGSVQEVRSHRHVHGENSGTFYIVPVHCPQLIDIRRELKLKTDWPLHLTIGRTYEYQARKRKR